MVAERLTHLAPHITDHVIHVSKSHIHASSTKATATEATHIREEWIVHKRILIKRGHH